jgi:archaellum component FlaC
VAWGVVLIPAGTEKSNEFERLEQAVSVLVEKYRVLRAEATKLRQELEAKEGRIHALDEQVLELNQSRQDVAKRIDDLIAHIDHLDAQFGAEG